VWFNATVTSSRWRVAGTAVVLTLSVRLCYIVIRFSTGSGAVKRPHIESAALLLAIAGLILRITSDTPGSAVSSARPRAMLWLAFLAGALLLYWPAVHVGLLSDDFILIQHASVWDMRQVAPQLFRPLPIFVWAVVVHLGCGPVTLHVVNILLHATNAWLAAQIVAGWVPGRFYAIAAGLLVLVAPLGPEAVAWCAGAFDLFAAAAMMSAVLVSRSPPTLRNRIQLIGLTLAALLSKETAVVLPMLILLDGCVRRSLARRAIIDLGLVTATVAIFAVIRLQLATGVVSAAISRYRIQRLVFDSFGTLGAPWQASDQWLTRVRAVYALCVIGVIAAFFVNRGARWASAAVLAGAGWVLASILPLLAFFSVGPQLEGARYLYLAACGWAAVLVTAAADLAGRGPRVTAITRGVLVVLIGAGAWGVHSHLLPWTDAAAVRDNVLRTAAADERLRGCPVAYVDGLPDSVGGAHLFANGAREALADVGVTAFAYAGTGDCAFRWDAAAERFERTTGSER